MSTEIPLPTGSYVTNDPRGSSKRLVGCFSEQMDTTSPADSKSKAVPIMLRRAPGTQQFAVVYAPGPVVITMTAGFSAPVLSATLAGTEIELSWTDADTVTSFELYRSLTGSDFTLYQTFASNVTSYNDTGLTPGQEYYYYVVGINGATSSANSNIVDNTIAVPTTPVLSFTPADLEADLSWTASTVQGSTIANYYLYRGVNGATPTLYQTLGDVTSYDDTGLTANDTYVYYVYAESADSRTSANSNSVSTTLTPALQSFTLQFYNDEESDGGEYGNGTSFEPGVAINVGTLVSGGGINGLGIASVAVFNDGGALVLPVCSKIRICNKSVHVADFVLVYNYLYRCQWTLTNTDRSEPRELPNR